MTAPLSGRDTVYMELFLVSVKDYFPFLAESYAAAAAGVGAVSRQAGRAETRVNQSRTCW